MTLVKIQKTSAYFKRRQVAYRRRRECKTDYKARRAMIKQDKSKYNAKKYRFIVRFSNKKITCQVAYATIKGDMIVAQALSTELPKFGIVAGLKNYAAAYATGLLCARRLLKTCGIDEQFKGKEEADGEEFHIEDEESDRRPFKAILDVGLCRTTVGHRVWGALKGAVDGGMHIPHNCKNFPGYKAPEERGQEGEYDAEAHREKILGLHVKEYMEMLEEEDPTKYEAHFSKYIEAGIDAEKMEEMYTEAHEKIREDPEFVPCDKKNITHTQNGTTVNSSDGTEHVRFVRLTLAQRQAKVMAKIEAAQEKMMADD